MTAERRYLWFASLVVALVAVGLFLVPRLREELAPEPSSALVAVELAGSGVAEVGRIRLESGQRFTLHAVLVAADKQGEPVYYSRAPALRVGGELVDPKRLRVWNRSGEIAVLWFTVEGFRPFMRVDDLEQLESFRFEESFRPEWGRGWTASGSVTPRNHALSRGFEDDQEVPFGTARYHVRIEKYFRAGDPAPSGSLPLAGRRRGFRRCGRTDTGRGDLAARPASVSVESFGTPQLEPAEASPASVLRELSGWYEEGLSFSRLLVFGGLLEDRRRVLSELEWASVDLELAPSWGEIGSGDLLRSGERLVLLYRDAGVEGVLDYEDLCFDLAESAAVRRLNEVFSGGGVLDWADLSADGNR